jgi:AraC-like DNA-binding protein
MRLAGNLKWQDTVSIIAPQIRADGVHVWPFDPSFPVVVTFQVFGERQPVRMNRHDYFELACVLCGEITCQVADRRFVAKKGELIVLGSALYHRMARNTRLHAKIATLFFMPEVICEAGAHGDEAEFLMPFYLQDASFPHLIPAKTGIPAEALSLIQRIDAELPATTSRARLSVRTCLKMILILLVNYYSKYIGSRQVDGVQQQASQRIAPLFEFLETHYNRAVAVEDAAELLRISKPHFMRVFKQVTGQSFISYLNHFRIAKAQALLTSSDKPISQLSQEVGFCDQSYFGSVFRKIARMTPMAYRRRFASSAGDTHIHSVSQTP